MGGLGNRLKKVTRQRIEEGKSLVLDENEFSSLRKQIGIADEGAVVKKPKDEKPVEEKTKNIVNERDSKGIRLYSPKDRLSNEDPSNVNSLAVAILQTYLSGDLDKIDSVVLPKEVSNNIIEIFNSVSMEAKRVLKGE